MALTILFTVFILMYLLAQKGKAYREEKRLYKRDQRREEVKVAVAEHRPLTEAQIQQIADDAKEDEYRAELVKQGYSDELITVILPTLMNDGK